MSDISCCNSLPDALRDCLALERLFRYDTQALRTGCAGLESNVWTSALVMDLYDDFSQALDSIELALGHMAILGYSKLV